MFWNRGYMGNFCSFLSAVLWTLTDQEMKSLKQTNKNTSNQYLWSANKAVANEKFISLKDYTRKGVGLKDCDLNFYPNKLKKSK